MRAVNLECHVGASLSAVCLAHSVSAIGNSRDNVARVVTEDPKKKA